MNNSTHPLAAAFADALEQATTGKGRDRHDPTGDTPWSAQPISQITRTHGVGFPMGQAEKKLRESGVHLSCGENRKAIAELLGAMVYAAHAVNVLEGRDKTSVVETSGCAEPEPVIRDNSFEDGMQHALRLVLDQKEKAGDNGQFKANASHIAYAIEQDLRSRKLKRTR